MITQEKRKKIINDIISIAIERGDVVGDKDTPGGKGSPVVQYRLNFRYCSLLISDDASVPVVEIAENYGSTEIPIVPAGSPFDGFRKLYQGSANGIDKIVLEAITLPTSEGLATSPSTRPFTDKDELTPKDKSTFDAFLMYAQRELKRSK